MSCEVYCREKARRRNESDIRKEISEILLYHGVETNSAIGFAIRGWAAEVLAVSIGFGRNRYRSISLYLAALCEQVQSLTPQQKVLIASDPSPISEASITTRILRGRAYCADLENNPQLELSAA
jgi:hypothetical protein